MVDQKPETPGQTSRQKALGSLLGRWGGAWLFYTALPLPWGWPWPLCFDRIAPLAPGIGMLLGALLALGDGILAGAGMPLEPLSALVVAAWLGLTGGLHLDGAMDTADGLGVPPDRRLAVMADSRTGAFGAMVAVVILGLKAVALGGIPNHRGWILMAVAGWSRWGPVVAIARYPYLRSQGKGARHKVTARPATDWVFGVVLLVGFAWVGMGWMGMAPRGIAAFSLGLAGLTLGLGQWFGDRLGGHTGDSYGAIVEWTEALGLCLALLWP